GISEDAFVAGGRVEHPPVRDVDGEQGVLDVLVQHAQLSVRLFERAFAADPLRDVLVHAVRLDRAPALVLDDDDGDGDVPDVAVRAHDSMFEPRGLVWCRRLEGSANLDADEVPVVWVNEALRVPSGGHRVAALSLGGRAEDGVKVIVEREEIALDVVLPGTEACELEGRRELRLAGARRGALKTARTLFRSREPP